MEWIKPPWRDGSHIDSDPFLAAVRVCWRRCGSRKCYFWEYWVLTWGREGLECDGELWSAWDADDIEWIARISEPPNEKAPEVHSGA